MRLVEVVGIAGWFFGLGLYLMSMWTTIRARRRFEETQAEMAKLNFNTGYLMGRLDQVRGTFDHAALEKVHEVIDRNLKVVR